MIAFGLHNPHFPNSKNPVDAIANEFNQNHTLFKILMKFVSNPPCLGAQEQTQFHLNRIFDFILFGEIGPDPMLMFFIIKRLPPGSADPVQAVQGLVREKGMGMAFLEELQICDSCRKAHIRFPLPNVQWPS